MTTITTITIRTWLDNAGLLEHLTAEETDRVVELLADAEGRPAYGEDWGEYLGARAQALVFEVAAVREFEIDGIPYVAERLSESRWSVRVEDPDSIELLNAGPANWASDEEIGEALGEPVRFLDRGDHPTADEAIFATVDEDEVESDLTAVETDGTWAVDDAAGGRWFPGTAAEDEIDASDDPAATAVRICRETPMRGTWRY